MRHRHADEDTFVSTLVDHYPNSTGTACAALDSRRLPPLLDHTSHNPDNDQSEGQPWRSMETVRTHRARPQSPEPSDAWAEMRGCGV